jgi:FHS family L-fucose permease-like MFS transporter
MTGAVATRTGNFHTAMAVPTGFYVLGWIYPVYANVWNRHVLDGHRETDLNVTGAHTVAKGDGDGEIAVPAGEQEKRGMEERVEEVR